MRILLDETKSEFMNREILSERDVYELLKGMASFSKEHFVALYLDSRNKVIALDTVSIGTLNSSLVHPREVFRPAIIHNCAAVIIAHNHPSGSCEPSDSDIELTGQLKKGGEILGIELLDHVIIGKDCYRSVIDRT